MLQHWEECAASFFLKMVKKTILTLAILWVIFEATVGLYASEHGASDMPWSKDRTDPRKDRPDGAKDSASVESNPDLVSSL